MSARERTYSSFAWLWNTYVQTSDACLPARLDVADSTAEPNGHFR
jgi:hypothetical protein